MYWKIKIGKGWFLGLGLLLGAHALYAHGNHEQEESAVKSGSSVSDHAALRDEQPSEIGQPPSLLSSLTEHVHNKLVHFPIALSLTALLFLLLSYRVPTLRPAVEVLVWLAALSAVFAVATGLLQKEAFEGTLKEAWVERHQILGITTTVSLFLWGFFFRFKPTRRWVLPWGVVVALLVSITGSIGGLLSHG